MTNPTLLMGVWVHPDGRDQESEGVVLDLAGTDLMFQLEDGRVLQLDVIEVRTVMDRLLSKELAKRFQQAA